MNMKHTPGPWAIAASSNPDNGTGWRDIVSTGTVFSPSYVGEALDDDAAFIVRACNSHDDLLAALSDFREWHANNFDDFAPDINAQLLCLDNAAHAALAKATGEV